MHNRSIMNYHARHEQVLRDMIQATDVPAPRIKEAMLYSSFPGGKRLRPVLVYLCGELLDVNLQVLDVIAVAIELIHSFSLIHDDLPAMDNDDYRRGKLSCHRAFDEATAVLTGDAMQALAIDILLTNLPAFLPMSRIVAVAHELLVACGPSGMVSGQSLDMTELTNPNMTEAMLCHIHNLKTGKLILACAKMVIAATHTGPEMADALCLFASRLGLLFQMQDDYLDQFGQNNALGKGRSSDDINEKQTFANLYDKASLADLIYQHDKATREALAIFGDKANDLKILLTDLRDRMLLS